MIFMIDKDSSSIFITNRKSFPLWISNINLYSNFVDHNFITTHPSIIKHEVKTDNFHFFFIPVDKNIECFDAFNMNPKNDLFYAMSHGVNRAVLVF